MKDKGHFLTSLVKSILRLTSCFVLLMTWDLIWFAYGFILAELLGIAEEIFDRR